MVCPGFGVKMQFLEILNELKRQPRNWLITGVAGFIGSNLLEFLLANNQKIIGIDNFSTGERSNLESVKRKVDPQQWKAFKLIEGDIRDRSIFDSLICEDINFILHQAALGSVPRSIKQPFDTHDNNVTGFLNVLELSRRIDVDAFVYASSSSVYGDQTSQLKIEANVGNLLSPYAVSKSANEDYANVYAKLYNINTVGLRYFNVFGRRQNTKGGYTAVIPKWISSIKSISPVLINGDGMISRDFCYIDNVIQANILACFAETKDQRVFNIACGESTTLIDLLEIIKNAISDLGFNNTEINIHHAPFRDGDILHSCADISAARKVLNYIPTHTLATGIKETVNWYYRHDNTKLKDERS